MKYFYCVLMSIALAVVILGNSNAAEGDDTIDLPNPVPSASDDDFWVQRIELNDASATSFNIVVPTLLQGFSDSPGSASIKYELKGESLAYIWRDEQWRQIESFGSVGQLNHFYVGILPGSNTSFDILYQAAPPTPASWQTTTPANLAPTPKPPHQWKLFTPWPVSGTTFTPLPRPTGTFMPVGSAAGCATKVVIPTGITAKLSGTIRGGLSFNDRPRGNGKFPSVNNGNTTLGGFRDRLNLFVSRLGYKYEVEVTYQGPLKDAFYGQMISGPHSLDPSKDVHVKFRDDTPANDWVGKKWLLKPGESKASFPTVEVVGQTVRWIDAPGSSVGRIQGTYYLVVVYAGACGAIEDTKILLITYAAPIPGGPNPTGRPEASVISPATLIRLADSINYQ